MKNFNSISAKNSVMVILTLVILGAGAFATNVQAQAYRPFEVQIPFDFVVKNKIYQAGTYRVQRLNPANPDLLILKNNGKKSLVVLTERNTGGAPLDLSQLTFGRYGGTYFLQTIRVSGESYESRLFLGEANQQRLVQRKLEGTVSITEK